MEKNKSDEINTSYKGNVLLRLLKYLKPYLKTCLIIALLCISMTLIDIIRPILISRGIDTYIEAYQKIYVKVDESNLKFKDVYLSEDLSMGKSYSSLLIYNDKYYYFDDLNSESLSFLNESIKDGINPDKAVNNEIVIGDLHGYQLNRTELSKLRSNDLKGLMFIAFVYAAILIIKFFMNQKELYLIQSTGQKVVKTLRAEIFNHINNLPLRFFDTHPIGTLVSRTANDTEAISELYSTVLTRMFTNIFYIIGLMVTMMIINFKLALNCFVLLPLIILLTAIFRHLSRKCYRLARTCISKLNAFLSENLSGMRLIQIFHNEDLKFKQFSQKNKELFIANFKVVSTLASFRPLIYFVGKMAVIFYLYSASKAYLTGSITIGTVYLFFDYISSFFEPIQDIAESMQNLQSAFAAGEKVFSILDVENTIKEKDKPIVPDVIRGEIEFKNVFFAYDTEEFVLKDVSFKIHEGEKVAFVGATGAGKSSILNLCGRYYDIQEGKILIDGVDIKDLSISKLRSAIGQVQQDVFIFDGDIASNIRLLNDEITDEDIKEACRLVNADTFIEELPNKYHEKVSERGQSLSYGQRQLLSFARTLAINPKILVMDEATANIDTHTEALIQKALEKLMEGRTTIMVAHRLSTIQHADKIIVMNNGTIAESGTHQELLTKNGLYKKLYDLQLYTS